MSTLRLLGAKAAESTKPLAELYPALPTWRVPRSGAAFVTCVALMVACL